jgi:putative ABC transport system ATP-binding protein
MNSSPSRELAVDIENLRHRYASGPLVLHIPKLEVARGERVFLFGPSGSGKTTLLGLLAGVLPPQEGTIRVLGQNLSALSPSDRDSFRGNHLGYIFQMFNLLPYLSVKDNIRLSVDLSPKRRARLPACEKALTALAASLGIEGLLDRSVTELSVGQQQRVAVARALLGSPELIVADEPTSSLDYDHRGRFLELLFAECRKTNATVLFVSHDRQLESLFDRCVSLKEINRA